MHHPYRAVKSTHTSTTFTTVASTRLNLVSSPTIPPSCWCKLGQFVQWFDPFLTATSYLHLKMTSIVYLPKYDPKDFNFPVEERQWRHCLAHIAEIQYRHRTFLPILKAVYTLEIPQRNWEAGYHSLADFRMKLRRVFYWWAHRTRGYLAPPTSSSAIPETTTDFGWTDRWYCFCTAVRRVFFEHNRRGNKGKRRKPMVQGFPQSILTELEGKEDEVRRDKWFKMWNAIKS